VQLKCKNALSVVMQGEGISQQQLHPSVHWTIPLPCSCARLWGRPTRHNGGSVGQVAKVKPDINSIWVHSQLSHYMLPMDSMLVAIGSLWPSTLFVCFFSHMHRKHVFFSFFLFFKFLI